MCRGGIRGLGPAFNQQLINFVHILGREFDRILVNRRHRRQVDARRGGLSAFGQLRSVGHLNYCPKGDNGIAIAPPLNIRTLQY